MSKIYAADGTPVRIEGMSGQATITPQEDPEVTELLARARDRHLVPLGGSIIARPLEQERTEGGILLPSEEAQRSVLKYTLGEVLAVGPGERDQNGRRMKLSIKVGDIVLYMADQSWALKWRGANVVITHERYLVAGTEPDGKQPPPEDTASRDRWDDAPQMIHCMRTPCKGTAALERQPPDRPYAVSRCMCGWETEAAAYLLKLGGDDGG